MHDSLDSSNSHRTRRALLRSSSSVSYPSVSSVHGETEQPLAPEVVQKPIEGAILPQYRQPLRPHRPSWLFSRTVDTFVLLLSFAFLMYGGLVVKYSGHPSVNIPKDALQGAAHYGPTVFPILFAAIVGQAMHAIALYRLERGERLGTLDQLLGSTTIFSAISTQFKLCAWGFVGSTLILLWTLSPLGGQASLRVISFMPSVSQMSSSVQYLGMNSSYLPRPFGTNNLTGIQLSLDQQKTLFGASLTGLRSTKQSSQDIWGNVKVPFIESLSTTDKLSSDGWLHVDRNLSTYSSQIGIPTSDIASDTETQFQMETSYWALDCPVLKQMPADFNFPNHLNRTTPNGSLWSGPTSFNSVWAVATWPTAPFCDPTYPRFSCMVNATMQSPECDRFKLSRLCDIPHTNVPARRINWSSLDDDGNFTYAECSMTTSYVEAQVSCSGSTCEIVRMRNSSLPHYPANWTFIDEPFMDWYNIFGLMSTQFNPTFGQKGAHGLALSQRYMLNPMDPFNVTFQPSLSSIGRKAFEFHLAQLLNTWWLAGIGGYVVPGGLAYGNSTTDTPGVMAFTQALTANATVTRTVEILVCSWPWLAVLAVATLAMLVTGVIGLTLGFMCEAPDLAMNMSSMIRDNPYVESAHISTTVGSAERSRLLKNVRVRYGDVKPRQEVGHIAIGSLPSEGEVRRLVAGRLFG